jgi:hypothetical protein
MCRRSLIDWSFKKKDGSVEVRLLNRLLIMALIEAKSYQCFKRLSEGLDDAYMRNFTENLWKAKPGIIHCSSIYPNCICLKKKYANTGTNG